RSGIDRLLSDQKAALTLLRRAMRTRERPVAVYVASQLGVPQVKRLFPDLVGLALFDHPDLLRVRETILKLPIDWLRSHVESAVRPALKDADDGTYRRLLELCAQIDPDLVVALATEAAGSADPDIREVGEDFLSTRPSADARPNR